MYATKASRFPSEYFYRVVFFHAYILLYKEKDDT
jgi:hypothetical protein